MQNVRWQRDVRKAKRVIEQVQWNERHQSHEGDKSPALDTDTINQSPQSSPEALCHPLPSNSASQQKCDRRTSCRVASGASTPLLHCRQGGCWRWNLLSHLGRHDVPQPLPHLQSAGKSLVTLVLSQLPVEALLLELALDFLPPIVGPAERLPLGNPLVGRLGSGSSPVPFKRMLHLLPCHNLLSRFVPRRVQFVYAAGTVVVDHNNRNPSSGTRWLGVGSVRYCLAQGNHFRCGTTADLGWSTP
jgi:hypothetical protein